MAPGGCPGVSVRPLDARRAPRTRPRAEPPPDVLIEAFGCDPAPELIARFAAAGAPDGARRVLDQPRIPFGRALRRAPARPALARVPGPGRRPDQALLLPRLHARDRRPAARGRTCWRAASASTAPPGWRGQGIAWRGERLVCLFCYEPPALDALLAQLERAGAEPTRLLVTAGPRQPRALPPGPAGAAARSRITWLPHVPQTEFDHLLWACDLNFVRGEDSLVRALWAGAPFVWQIYPQDDDAHHVKLDAFLDWLEAPPSLRSFHHLWNGMASGESAGARRRARWPPGAPPCGRARAPAGAGRPC